MNSDPTRPDPIAPTLPNLAARVVQLFVSPARLFERLRERPAWVGALVLLILLGVAIQAVIPEELVREAMLERAPADAPPEALEAQLRFASWIRFAGTVVITPAFLALLAGVVLLLFNVIGGGSASFVQAFSAVTHVNFIPTLGALVTLPLMLAAGDLHLQFSLGLLTPFLDPDGIAGRWMNGLNVFGIWATIVLGIAVSRLYPGRSARGAAAVLLALYVVAKGVGAALGGVFG